MLTCLTGWRCRNYNQDGDRGNDLVRSATIGAVAGLAFLLAAAGPSRAQFCRAADGERVADEIVKIFNDLSVDNALICTAADSHDQCEIVCTSPQKISTAHRRNDVLPLLTAVAGLTMQAIERSNFSVLTFMDDGLAAQGRSLQLSAARALDLYTSLDAGKTNVDDFRADVAREFSEKSNAPAMDAVQEAPAVTMIPRPSPRTAAWRAEELSASKMSTPETVEPPALSKVPLPRPRPKRI